MTDDILQRLTATIASRKGAAADTSYVAKLFAKGEDAILKKVGEEAAEVLLAAKNGDKGQIVYETADLLFHCLIMLEQYGLRFDDVLKELERREGVSGITEKQGRGTD